MDTIKEYGQNVITTEKGNRIRIVTVIGEIEGHTVATDSTKTTNGSTTSTISKAT